MAGFYYCLRGAQPEDVVQDKRLVQGPLRKAGLEHVFADVVDVPDDCMVSGPSTVSTPTDRDSFYGTVLYPKTPYGHDPKSWKHNPDVQTWQPYGDRKDVWIGWETDNPPTPVDLARRVTISGREVADQLGTPWVVPVARSHRGNATLPVSYRFAGEQVEPVVDPKYAGLWDLSGAVRDFWHEALQVANVDAWKCRAALNVLQANYRIGPEELNVLHDLGRPVLHSGNLDVILFHFIDWDLPTEYFDLFQKKTGNLAAD